MYNGESKHHDIDELRFSAASGPLLNSDAFEPTPCDEFQWLNKLFYPGISKIVGGHGKKHIVWKMHIEWRSEKHVTVEMNLA